MKLSGVEAQRATQHKNKTNICYTGQADIFFYHCWRLYQSICCYIQLCLVKWYYKRTPVGVKLLHRSICRGNTARYLSIIISPLNLPPTTHTHRHTLAVLLFCLYCMCSSMCMPMRLSIFALWVLPASVCVFLVCVYEGADESIHQGNGRVFLPFLRVVPQPH